MMAARGGAARQLMACGIVSGAIDCFGLMFKFRDTRAR